MMKIRKNISNWRWAIGAVALLLAGCTSSQNQATAPTAENVPPTETAPKTEAVLTAAGATFPYPLYSKWFDAFQSESGVKINYQPVGSGAGIKQMKNQTVDFGASDAPLDDKDAQEMPKPLLQIPTVAGAVVVAYNLPTLKAPLKLDQPTLAGIFLGKITRWNDKSIAALNAGVTLPDLPISVGHRSDGSGTSFIFTSYLAAVSPEWKSKVGAGKSVDWPVGIGGKGNAGVAGVIKQSPGAIGYIEQAYAEQNNFKTASLRNKEGNFVQPTVDATTAAIAGAMDDLKTDIRSSIVDAPGKEAYPIAGLTYLLVYADIDDAGKSESIKAFLEWAMTKGQEMAPDLLYAPLPSDIVEINKASIDRIK